MERVCRSSLRPLTILQHLEECTGREHATLIGFEPCFNSCHATALLHCWRERRSSVALSPNQALVAWSNLETLLAHVPWINQITLAFISKTKCYELVKRANCVSPPLHRKPQGGPPFAAWYALVCKGTQRKDGSPTLLGFQMTPFTHCWSQKVISLFAVIGFI